jgi:glycosyltransferase involved in cell wall biosynthesis
VEKNLKILLTLFEIQDYGGIVGDVEFLMKGLKEHGHHVDLVLLRDSDRDVYIRKPEGPTGSYTSVSGGQANTLAGWYGIPVMGYGSPARIRAWQSFANGYDLVIHEIPGPKLVDETNYDWRDIYDIRPVQIIAAHDAHFRDMYPHIREVADRITAITCTNPAGYKALEWCPIPRAFIGAAHEVRDWTNDIPWGRRHRTACCAHVWKAWKHMEKVVGAAPLICENTFLWMAGDGIERRYMASPDPNKVKYPGLWGAARKNTHKFAYFGLMTHSELFSRYISTQLMVDMSFSKKFYALGNHFNRSVIEAYNTGMLPLCTVENMLDEGMQRQLFKHGETHIGIPASSDYEDVATAIDWCLDLSSATVERIIANGREILKEHFDYKRTSLQYLDLAAGKPAGIYPNLETGRWPE